MANKVLKSLTFPGLNDVYKIPQEADEYSASATYAVGDYCIKDGVLYRCTTAITTAEAWTAGHWTATQLADEVTSQSEKIVEIDKLYEYDWDIAENLFDISNLVAGKYVNQANGQLADNASYTASQFIDVSEFDYVLFRRKTLSGFAVRWCTYNANKAYIEGEIYNSDNIFSDGNYIGEAINFYRVDTTNASWFRFSATNSFFNSDNNPGVIGGYYPRYMKPYSGKHQKLALAAQDNRIPSALNESVGGEYYNSINNQWIQNGRSFKIGPTQALKGNESIYLFANIYTMGELSIGFLDDTYTFHIDGTNYWWNDGDHYAHNLTIKNYIAITVELEEDGAKANFKVETNGGEWTRTNTTFIGTRGRVTISSGGFAGNINVTWMPKISKPIWVFGDSYISNYATTRWGYYLIQWGLSNNSLFDGYPGAGAETAIVDFENLLTMGSPRYAIWCMGMNNADSGAINSDWKTATDKFISLCLKYNIIPILATIPNVPARDHTYKNTYVKGLGYRYVNFAKAVNAESAGSTWYDGMLEENATPANRVHPTADGAICLASQFIASVPEVTFK